MSLWGRIVSFFKHYYLGLHGLPPTSVGSSNTQISGLTQKYDTYFRKHRGAIPLEYLRALAYSESRMNPDSELDKDIDTDTARLPSGKKDSYWGLFQVGKNNVLADYNKRHGTNHQPVELFNPDLNTQIAAETLNRIVSAYGELAHREGISELRMNWDDRNYVRLVTAGWNSGYSRVSGVQAVARWLHERSIPVTHDNIFKHAAVVPHTTKYLDINQYAKKRKWQRLVADRYFKEKGQPVAIHPPEPPKPSGGGGGVIAASLLGLAGLLALAAKG